jgi:hypothetical protein
MKGAPAGNYLLLLCAVACSHTISTEGLPTGESPTVEPHVGTVDAMTMWLSEFRVVQRDEFLIHNRYCSEVTCGNRVKKLPAPYKTRYRVSPSGKSYEVDITNEDDYRTCHLEEGFDAYPERAGRIVCR